MIGSIIGTLIGRGSLARIASANTEKLTLPNPSSSILLRMAATSSYEAIMPFLLRKK